MVVLVLERVPVSLKGELTQWFLEVKSGVFVGDVSARVRDKLWEKVCASRKDGSAIMIYGTNTEQGYALRTEGDTSREVVDFDGLFLIRSK